MSGLLLVTWHTDKQGTSNIWSRAESRDTQRQSCQVSDLPWAGSLTSWWWAHYLLRIVKSPLRESWARKLNWSWRAVTGSQPPGPPWYIRWWFCEGFYGELLMIICPGRVITLHWCRVYWLANGLSVDINIITSTQESTIRRIKHSISWLEPEQMGERGPAQPRLVSHCPPQIIKLIQNSGARETGLW